jgi:plasmid replication initiation protein
MAMRRKYPSERDQLALFRALPGDLAPRDAQDLMAYPFFSLAKTKRVVPIDFRAGAITIRVEAVPEHGMATIWDADVLIWPASQIVEARDSGLKTSRLMAATPYEILTFAGRSTCARDYDQLKAGLDRLQSTTVLNRRERSACSATLGRSMFRRCALVIALQLGNQQPSKAWSAP